MQSESSRNVRIAQKEKLLLREISSLFMKASMDEPKLRGFTITRVELSSDKGFCSIYFYTPEGRDFFHEALEILKLYKPSLRKALSGLKARYTPDLVFKFDDQFEKQMRIETLLEKVKNESPEDFEDIDQDDQD